MKFIAIIMLILLVLVLNFFENKYVRLSMVLHSMFIMGIILLLNGIILVFIYVFFNELPLGLKLFLIIISILPVIFMREYIDHTIRILDFYIYKRKMLEKGIIKKGVIREIKSYGFYIRRINGYYLIVDFDGKKIKSIPLSKCYLNKLYNIGDEIDVIVYRNKKYVIVD